jgi:hypothetical protein
MRAPAVAESRVRPSRRSAPFEPSGCDAFTMRFIADQGKGGDARQDERVGGFKPKLSLDGRPRSEGGC